MPLAIVVPVYAKPDRVIATDPDWSPTELTNGHWYNGADAVATGGSLDAWISRVHPGGTSVPVVIVGDPDVAYNGWRYVGGNGTSEYLTANALALLVAGGPVLMAVTVQFDSLPAGDNVLMSLADVDDPHFFALSTNDGYVTITSSTTGGATQWKNENPLVGIGEQFTIIVYFDGTSFNAWLNAIPFYRNEGMPSLGLTAQLFTMLAFSGDGVTNGFAFARIFHAVFATPATFTIEDAQLLTATIEGFDPMRNVTQPFSNERRVYQIIGEENAVGTGDTVWPVEYDVPLVSVLEVNEYQAGPLALRQNGAHGPEFGIATECAELELAPAIIKRAVSFAPLADKGGTPLAWLPTADEHYDRTVLWTEESALPLLGTYFWPEAVAAVLVWLGETDAEVSGDATAFGTNVGALATALRADYGNADLKVVLVMLHKDSPKAFATTMRTSMNAFSAAHDQNLLIIPHDIDLDVGLVRYTGDGTNKVGERFVQAVEYPGIIEWHGSARYDSAVASWGAYRAKTGRAAAVFTEGTNKPGNTTLNGIPCLLFDGVNDMMTYNGLASLYSDPVGFNFDFGLSLVLQIEDTTTEDRIFEFGGAGPQEFSLFIDATDKLAFRWTNDAGVSTVYTSTYTVADSFPHLISIDKYYDGTFVVYVDNAQVLNITADAGAMTLTTFVLGAAVGGGNHAAMRMAHLSFDVGRATSKRLADETRLIEWWRLSVVQGSGIFDHTFDLSFN